MKTYHVCLQFSHGEAVIEVEAADEDKAEQRALEELQWAVANYTKLGWITEME